jgi:hypothetical protein
MTKVALISGEKILLMGLLLTPFTSLRNGFILGPGEFLILISTLIALVTNGMVFRLDKRLKIFYRFWSAFLIISFLGVYVNNFLIEPSGIFKNMVFDIFSYMFILLTIVLIGHYAKSQKDFPETFFKKLFVYWGVIYVALFFISFFTRSIFGMPLRYHMYFSPLVENVHQAAMITCSMPFVLLYLGHTSPKFYLKALYIIGALLFCYMAISSNSTKAFLGVIVGVLIGLVHLVGYKPTGKGRYLFNTLTLLVSIASLVVLTFFYYDEIFFLAVQFFTENDGSGARETLYINGFANGLNSPIIGHGPGSHAPYAHTFSDAHNTSLTIFLQAGLVGFIFFIWFNLSMLNKLSIHFALFAAMASIGMYIIGGDILRRLPIWVMLIGIYYLAIYHPLKKIVREK